MLRAWQKDKTLQTDISSGFYSVPGTPNDMDYQWGLAFSMYVYMPGVEGRVAAWWLKHDVIHTMRHGSKKVILYSGFLSCIYPYPEPCESGIQQHGHDLDFPNVAV